VLPDEALLQRANERHKVVRKRGAPTFALQCCRERPAVGVGVAPWYTNPGGHDALVDRHHPIEIGDEVLVGDAGDPGVA
jgi:hypothetical protein